MVKTDGTKETDGTNRLIWLKGVTPTRRDATSVLDSVTLVETTEQGKQVNPGRKESFGIYFDSDGIEIFPIHAYRSIVPTNILAS